ncbi:hypothetical protein DPV78_010738 [Talaromyces pinophilus]|nr:hypothetical protein DPV78_010738 [Talaromyces pinophilus]
MSITHEAIRGFMISETPDICRRKTYSFLYSKWVSTISNWVANAPISAGWIVFATFDELALRLSELKSAGESALSDCKDDC